MDVVCDHINQLGCHIKETWIPTCHHLLPMCHLISLPHQLHIQQLRKHHQQACFTSSTATLNTPSSATTPKAHSTSATATQKTPSSATTTPKTPKSTTGSRSPLSDLLNLPANVHGSKQSKTPNTGHARVLTSRECLQMLKEKEEKKKQVQLEKERRKIEKRSNEETEGRGAETTM